ncbi:hypothetical protein MMC28_005085 [Mycoblastus sanguinarius]|nr:hypothetical protein [Mycoblastus sanguinarius]
MEPWQSWAIVGVVGVGACYYYSQSGNPKRGRVRVPFVPAEQNQRRGSNSRNDSNDKRKKKDKNSDTSDQPASDAADAPSASIKTKSTDRVKKRKGGKQQPSKLAQISAVEVNTEPGVDIDNEVEGDEGMDNTEFARQLSGLKTGTSLKKPVTNNEIKKTRKQGKRIETPAEPTNGFASNPNGVPNPQELSTASSTTGADADDDMSPAVSPEFGATQTTTPSGADVSDMLEPAAKGPSVLRLTESTNPQPVRLAKQPKVAQEPETQKQRQNRRKNEAKKTMREEAEKERRVLLEKQLRTAREAEGRPAKNGLGSSKPPSTNAWEKSTGEASGSNGPPKPNNGPLLDTFDEVTSTSTSDSPGLNGGANNTSIAEKTWNRDLPSEEEQMRMISEMDSDNTWSTVAKGGKSKKKSASTTTIASNNKPSTENEKMDAPSGMKAEKEGNSSKKTTANTNGNIKEVAARTNTIGKEQSEPVKATKETIDHSIWTRENIHEHPDYDPDFPYALTGHPDDSDWAVV